MTKENILFLAVGLLLGLIVGFVVTNNLNQSGLQMMPGGAQSTTGLPSGHPGVPGDPSQPGGMQDVQAAIEKARQNPDDFNAQLNAAKIYYQIQRFDGAVEFLKRANELKPDDYDTLVNLANAYFDAGKYEDAEKAYSSALEKKKDDVNVRTDLGLTFIFRDNPDYDRAIKEFTASLQLDPLHVQTLQNLTVAYTKKGDAAKANETLAKLESVDAGNAAIARLREDIGKIAAK